MNCEGFRSSGSTTSRSNTRGAPIGTGRVDFLVAGSLVVELKTVNELAPVHSAQVISYLKATGCKLGLLLNFNSEVMREGINRIILS